MMTCRTTGTNDVPRPMRFAPNGYFSGNFNYGVDLTAQLPWLYIIACPSSKIVYVGETCARGGLLVRLSSHFGVHEHSSLRSAAAKVAGVEPLKSPFIVVAAALPTEDTEVNFDGSSGHVRRLCEGLLHINMANFIAARRAWTVVSSSQASTKGENSDMVDTCNAISASFASIMDFLDGLASLSPFHLVTLGRVGTVFHDTEVGLVLNQIEVILYEWILDGLNKRYGPDWWTKGVPVNLRKQCVVRAEEEGKGISPEAYFTFIDLRVIVQSNWDIFGPSIEKISRETGKQRSTEWLVELNEARNIWAHPIKQRFVPISPERRSRFVSYLNKMKIIISAG